LNLGHQSELTLSNGASSSGYHQHPFNQQQLPMQKLVPTLNMTPTYPLPNSIQQTMNSPFVPMNNDMSTSNQINQQKIVPNLPTLGRPSGLISSLSHPNDNASLSADLASNQKVAGGKYYAPTDNYNMSLSARKVGSAPTIQLGSSPKPAPVQPMQVPMAKAKSSTNIKSLTMAKDREKAVDKDRFGEREDSLANLQRRRDIVSMKLALVERRLLVGSKGPGPLTVSPKTKWDFVMNEAQWLAVDFHQELRWKLKFSQVVASLCKEHVLKRRSARPLPVLITDYRQYVANRSSDTSLKSIANRISTMISHFWSKFQPEWMTANASVEITSDKSAVLVTAGSSRHARTVSNSLSSNNPVGGLGVVLLDYQRNILNKIAKINESGYGCMVYGRRLVGKTILLVAAVDSWLSRKPLVPKAPNQALIFASRRSCLRWLAEIERVLPLRSVSLWLPASYTQNMSDLSDHSDVDISSPFPSSDIVLCVLDIVADYAQILSSSASQARMNNISGILFDIRGLTDLMVGQTASKQAPSWISSIAITFKDASIHRALVLDDLPSATQLQSIASLLDPSSFEKDASPKKPSSSQTFDEANDDDWKDWIQSSVFFPSQSPKVDTRKKDFNSLLVEVVVGNSVESFAAAQVREEVVSQDMDSLQHLKYFQVMDTLLSQSSFQGDNPWILAQALTLLRRVCFHEAFVSIGNSRKSPLYSFNSYDDGNSGENSIGLGFGLTQASLYTGIPANALKWKIDPSVHSFIETIQSEVSSIPIASLDSAMENLRKYMSVTADEDPCPVARNMTSCFAPGPLSSKLASPARFNMNGNFYDSIGSCKLQVLCALIARFSGLRIVIVVSSIDEQLTVHNFLNRLGFEHMYAGLGGSKLNTPISVDASGFIDIPSWLRAQTVIQKFNRTSQTASAILLITKDVFLQPGLLPWKADVVIILSDDWITPTDIRSCFRLRLTSAGPSGDPVTVVRIVAKGTLEELVARRGSLLNLQGIALGDLFPAFAHTLQTTISTGISTLSSMLYRAPSASLVRKIRDISILPVPISPSPSSRVNLTNPSPSPQSSDDAIANCTAWLQTLRLGLIFAEFQFSRLGKYVPDLVQTMDQTEDCLALTLSSTSTSKDESKSSEVALLPRSLASNLLHGRRSLQTVLREVSVDIAMRYYINQDSLIGKQNKSSATNLVAQSSKSKVDISERIVHPMSPLVLRLVDASIRDMMQVLSNRAEELTCKNYRDCIAQLHANDLQRLRLQGIGLSVASPTEQVFHQLIKPIVPFNIPAEIPREGRELLGPVVSSSQGQNGTPFFRSSQLFRQVLQHNRREGIAMDPHLYTLNGLQTASLTDHVIRSGVADIAVMISLPDAPHANQASDKSTATKRSSDATSATSGYAPPVARNKSEDSKSHPLNTLLKADLTNVSFKVEFEPSVFPENQKASQSKPQMAEEMTTASQHDEEKPSNNVMVSGKKIINCFPVAQISLSLHLSVDMINEGRVEQTDRADMEKWLLSEDGLVLCIPALFDDSSFELTARLLNHILRIREDLTIASPRTPKDVELRHAQLTAENLLFQSKVSHFIPLCICKQFDLIIDHVAECCSHLGGGEEADLGHGSRAKHLGGDDNGLGEDRSLRLVIIL
jgi:hypothetical protein